MTTSIWIILFLGAVQGLTEFFPVSSSGHLVVLEALFGARGGDLGGGVLFEVAVHVGTLGAIVLVYRGRIASLLSAAAGALSLRRGRGGACGREIRYLWYLVLGTIPAAFAGLAFRGGIARAFDSPLMASICLVATACYLFLGRGRDASRELDARTALIIGVAQAVAILPGISRSGWTITTALILGVPFAAAAEFSFVLSIPAILGALVLELAKTRPSFELEIVLPLVLGAAAAFAAGWIALKLVLRMLTKGSFHRFAYYLVPAGIASAVYFAIR